MLFPGFYVQTAVIALVIGYILGDFQSAVFLSKRFLKDDVRLHGSGNPGATNMTRSFGTKWGVITFFFDAAKCALAILLGRWMGKAWELIPGNVPLSVALTGYFGGVGAVLGHCWPLAFNFKGGKGSACNFAFMFLTFPLGAGMTALVALATYFFSKKISLVSLVSALFFVIFTVVFHASRPWLWAFAFANTTAVFIRHSANIKRLAAGTESKIDY